MDVTNELEKVAFYQGENSFIHFGRTEGELEEALGIAISVWSEWDGFKIMRVLFSALEDSNFHEWAGRVQAMMAEEGGNNDNTK